MPTVTDSEIRDALSAIRDVEPTDADVRRATIAARPQPRAPRRRSVARPQPRAPRRRSAAAVAAEQPAMASDGYRYAQLVSRMTRASMVRGCATCVGSVTWEQDNEQWSPAQWRDGRRRYGAWRIVERVGDEQRQSALTKYPPSSEGPRLLPDPSLQDIPFADLPTDPEALRNLLQAAVLDLRWAGRARGAITYERDAINEGRPPTPEQTRSMLIGGVTSILGDAHITPRLRSALFGVLATIDGARALGRVTDPLGRSGEGVAFDVESEDAALEYPAFERRIVFAPDTSELLTVSVSQRNPSVRPVPKAHLKARDVTWISNLRTVYVRTGDVAKVDERP
jgi:hypothetical protein